MAWTKSENQNLKNGEKGYIIMTTLANIAFIFFVAWSAAEHKHKHRHTTSETGLTRKEKILLTAKITNGILKLISAIPSVFAAIMCVRNIQDVIYGGGINNITILAIVLAIAVNFITAFITIIYVNPLYDSAHADEQNPDKQ